eukprot:Trichotokara_eunicae@DN6087_c0_g1_i1.p1
MLEDGDKYFGDFHTVVRVAQVLNIRPVYVPIAALCALCITFGIFQTVITGAVGFFYPAWKSFKAIESQDKNDDKQWLTYWVVYAFFSFIEIFGDTLLFWVPFYYVVKIVFLLWLFLPSFMGATWVYNKILRPFLQQHADTLDRAAIEAASVGTKVVDSAATFVSEIHPHKHGLRLD